MAVQTAGPYTISERVSSSVWKAQDTRNGKVVALKILSKQLPKDPARRDALLREARVSAALYHTFVVPILEVNIVGDNLVMAMEWLEVVPLSSLAGELPLDRDRFVTIAYEVVDALKFLHLRGLVHGNVNPDSIMMTNRRQVRLGGFNAGNLLRRDASYSAYHQKGGDPKCVAYMAPEQITGETADARTDVFSAGVVMYELAAGRIPWPATEAGEIARTIVEGQPASPKSVNPSIDPAVLNVLGRSLFKDPSRRFKDAKALLEEIAKIDPEAARAANDVTTRIVGGASETAVARREAILLLADVADHEQLVAADPDAAAKAAARMQQVLGESVYLFDGKVIDPFGPRLVAELPNVEAALNAARKGEFDFSPSQQVATPIRVRLLLHAGPVSPKEGTPAGEGITKGLEVLSQLLPSQLMLSEDFVRKGRGNVRLRDAGARAGVKLFSIVGGEPDIEFDESAGAAEEIDAAAITELGGADPMPEDALPAAAPSRRRTGWWIAAALVVLACIAGAVFLSTRPEEAARPREVSPVVQPAPPVHNVVLEPFTVEATDPGITNRANGVRLATAEILRHTAGVRVEPSEDAVRVSGRIINGQAGTEFVPTVGPVIGRAVAMTDSSAAVAALVQHVAAQLRISAPALPSAPVLNDFVDALAAREAGDSTRTAQAFSGAAQAAPDFLPLQLAAFEYFSGRGMAAEAAYSGSRVVALDPKNAGVARKVASAALEGGNLSAALAAFGAILKTNPADPETLMQVARFSAAVADAAKFNAALKRLSRVDKRVVTVHAPDLLLAAGKIETAVQQYYDIEADVPNNPKLALKIGRIAVLRRSVPIAELELGKLRQLDPVYAAPLLQAYLAAEKRDASAAKAALEKAGLSMTAADDYWTSAAEVHAMLEDGAAAVTALEKAVGRAEPTGRYILSNPLFSYLHNDPRFQPLRERIAAQDAEIRTALSKIPL